MDIQNLAEFVSELVAVFKSEKLVGLRLKSVVDFIGYADDFIVAFKLYEEAQHQGNLMCNIR